MAKAITPRMTNYTVQRLQHVASFMMPDSKSTAYGVLSLLENEGATVEDLKTETGALEWFAKEEVVVMELFINQDREAVASTAVGYIHDKLKMPGYIGITLHTVDDDRTDETCGYNATLHHDLVLVIPRGSSCDVDTECYVVDAFVGCTNDARVWKWNNWRAELHELLTCVDGGETRISLWKRILRLEPRSQEYLKDTAKVKGLKMRLFY